MKVKEILKVMTETKDIIIEAQKASPYFSDDIWDEEVSKMVEDHPEMDNLSPECFRWLWAKA